MPRAYYRPFTVYEEAVGFRAARRNAHILCALLFGGLLIKLTFLMKYSSVVNPNWTSPLAHDERYERLVEQRLALTEDLATQEAMRKAMRNRRGAPPA